MQDFKARTKRFALDVILYSRKLPRTDEINISLLHEADELVAVITSSRKRARG